jgi:hypothetical protein
MKKKFEEIDVVYAIILVYAIGVFLYALYLTA